MRIPRWLRYVIGIFIALILVYYIAGGFLQPLSIGPQQPIPFSHRIHVKTKQLNCFFCHPYATTSSNVGMPAVQKCLLCHRIIASNFAPIARIRMYDRRNEGVPWVRVARIPDFVHFNHKPHLAFRIDCGQCHGNIREMDRVRIVHTLNMNFCTSCHKQYEAPVDCVTCHY